MIDQTEQLQTTITRMTEELDTITTDVMRLQAMLDQKREQAAEIRGSLRSFKSIAESGLSLMSPEPPAATNGDGPEAPESPQD